MLAPIEPPQTQRHKNKSRTLRLTMSSPDEPSKTRHHGWRQDTWAGQMRIAGWHARATCTHCKSNHWYDCTSPLHCGSKAESRGTSNTRYLRQLCERKKKYNLKALVTYSLTTRSLQSMLREFCSETNLDESKPVSSSTSRTCQ